MTARRPAPPAAALPSSGYVRGVWAGSSWKVLQMSCPLSANTGSSRACGRASAAAGDVNHQAQEANNCGLVGKTTCKAPTCAASAAQPPRIIAYGIPSSPVPTKMFRMLNAVWKGVVPSCVLRPGSLPSPPLPALQARATAVNRCCVPAVGAVTTAARIHAHVMATSLCLPTPSTANLKGHPLGFCKQRQNEVITVGRSSVSRHGPQATDSAAMAVHC